MKALLLFSGGMDSTFLLHELTKEKVGTGIRQRLNPVKDVICLSFIYGQPHADKELTAAKAYTEKLGVKHLFEKLDFPFLSQDMAGDNPVVPNRNAIFISVAAAIAQVNECAVIYIGCTQSDFDTFPDCRPAFLRSIDEAMTYAVNIRVVAPLVGQTKSDIVKLGKQYQIDWGETWSCYAGADEPCGKCAACIERTNALGD